MENLDPAPPQIKNGENWAFLPFARLYPWFGGDGGLLFHFILSKIVAPLFTFSKQIACAWIHVTASNLTSYSVAPSTKEKDNTLTLLCWGVHCHSHINSCNQGSFSKQEREPWERGCLMSSLFVTSSAFMYSISPRAICCSWFYTKES